ncbi:MAG: hypothetical protein ACYCV0_02070 [Desulfitobacteriaceae bacterium]
MLTAVYLVLGGLGRLANGIKKLAEINPGLTAPAGLTATVPTVY